MQVYYNHKELGKTYMRKFCREGITQTLHDELAEIIDCEKNKNLSLTYTPQEASYEGKQGEMTFCMPHDTDELKKIGKMFHNCVASYRDMVLEHRCVIVYLTIAGKPKACMEMHCGRIVQALGPCNTPLDEHTLQICMDWVDRGGRQGKEMA